MNSVVIIGSGIAGSAAFYAAARRGMHVTLVDDGATGQATAASAGIIEPWSSSATGAYYDLYAAGAAYYPELLSQLAELGIGDTTYRQTGSLIVNSSATALDEAEALLAQRRAAGGAVMGTVRRIDNAQARECFPPLADGLDAVHISGGGRVDGRAMRDALIEAGKALGGTVRRGFATLESATSVNVDGVRIDADVVIVASGAWASDILVTLGLRTPVQPQRGQITHLRMEGVDTSAWPSVHPLSHHYIVAFGDSRVAVGATRENGVGFDPRVTAEGQAQVLNDALSIAPGLAKATLIETRVGLRPLADDQLPIVGAVPGHEGLFVATGYGAGGLTMGPLLGNLLASLISGEKVDMLNVASPRARMTES